MAALTDTGELLVLAWLLTTGTAVRPTAWYVALHTADPTETGAVAEVTTGIDANYIRKSITFATPASGQDLSNASVSWTVNSGSGGYTVTHVSIWTQATAGICLLKGELLAYRALVANGVLTFNSGDIVAAAD